MVIIIAPSIFGNLGIDYTICTFQLLCIWEVIIGKANDCFCPLYEQRWVESLLEMIFHVSHLTMISFF